jgi:hypothetical protein
MQETTNPTTGEKITYNRIGGTPETPIYFNDPTPVSTSVVNSKSAKNDLSNIQTQTNQATTDMSTQATNVANYTAQQTAEAKAKADADAKAKLEADKLAIEQQNANTKSSALSGTPQIGSKEYDIAHGLPPGTSSQAGYKAPLTTGQTLDQAELDRQKYIDEYTTQAKQAQDTITQIQNGTVPLSPDQQAQIEGLRQNFQALIDKTVLQNKTDIGLGNIRGYQKGSAEYDPTFQVKTIGSIITGGVNKIADLNSQMASAIGKLRESFKTGNIQATKDAFGIYKDASDKRLELIQKTIDDTQKAIKDANDSAQEAEKRMYDQVTKPINDIAIEAKKNGADDATLQAIYGSKNVANAVQSAGSYLQAGSGIVGEYMFYKRQAEAQGLTPKSFDDYQNEDANRKKAIAGATGLPNSTVLQIDKLASGYDTSPIVKNYNEVQNKKITVDSILNSGIKGPGDLAIVYEFMKALDPTSVVRETEYDTASKAGNIFSGIYARFNGYLTSGGGFLPDKVKKDFQSIVDLKLNAAKSQYDNLRKETARKINIKTGEDNGEDYLTDYSVSLPSTIIDKQVQAKDTVDEYYISNPQERAFIDELQDTGRSDEEILDWLKRNNKISFKEVSNDTKKVTRADKNNNPLNIKASGTTLAYEGVSGKDPKPASDGGQFLTFETPEAGFKAAKKLLTANSYADLTLDKAMKRWSGGGYGADVSNIPANKKIKDLTQSELDKLIKDMAKREGYSNIS